MRIIRIWGADFIILREERQYVFIRIDDGATLWYFRGGRGGEVEAPRRNANHSHLDLRVRLAWFLLGKNHAMLQCSIKFES